MPKFEFPTWTDRLVPVLGAVIVLAPVYLVAMVYYGGSPQTTDVGYRPIQPVEFSHAMHAGDLGIDCRYCHNTVDRAAFAAVPPTATCMNCHKQIAADGEKLLLVRQAAASGDAIPWIRVNDLPDYVYFDHSAHVTRGVSCVSCHGRIDKMERVYQAHTLSMGWCLDCHRNPEPHLRPQSVITDLDWEPGEDPVLFGERLRKQNNINPKTDCSTCHR
jgi:hypothetical protein